MDRWEPRCKFDLIRRPRRPDKSGRTHRRQGDHRIALRPAFHEILNTPRERRRNESDEWQKLAALARGLAFMILGVGTKTFVPPDQREGSIGAHRRVNERLLRAARILRQEKSARLV